MVWSASLEPVGLSIAAVELVDVLATFASHDEALAVVCPSTLDHGQLGPHRGDDLLCRHVPYPDRSAADRGQDAAVRCDCHIPYLVYVFELGDLRAADPVPDLHRFVTNGREPGSVRGDGEVVQLEPAAGLDDRALSAGQIPHDYGPVAADTDEPGAVRRDRHVPHLGRVAEGGGRLA